MANDEYDYNGPYRSDIFQDIDVERDRQDELKALGKFPMTCADLEMTHPERLSVLVEEVGEVSHEVNEAIGRQPTNRKEAALRRADLRKELVQVAAVCVAWVEAIDREMER